MKKLLALTVLFAAVTFTSCGSKDEKADDKDAKEEGNATEDGNKLCECVKGTIADPAKYAECEKLEKELREKYKEGTDEFKEIDKIMTDCSEELSKLMQEQLEKSMDTLNMGDTNVVE